MSTPEWPIEKVELLKQFHTEKCGNYVIARRMSEQGYPTTRNAVIGKLYRLGLIGNKKSKKDRPAPQRIKKTVISSPPPPRRIVPKLRRKVIVPATNGAHHNGGTMSSLPEPTQQILLTETKDDNCRAIIGYRNGIAAEAVVCGKPTIWKVVNGKRTRGPWCEFHEKLYVREAKR